MTALWGWLVAGGLGPNGHLVWNRPGSEVAAIIAAGALAWGLAWWTGRRNAGGLGRVGELLLWAGAVAVLVAAVAGPTWVEQRTHTEAGPLVVLIDDSASMSVQENDSPRSEKVKQVLGAVKAAAGPGGMEVYSFDEDVRPGAPGAYQGRGTDVGLALSTIADRYLGRAVRGVVMITDGIDHGALRASLMGTDEDTRAAATAQVPDLPGPLTIYQVGRVSDLKDLAIDDVSSGGFAFLRTPFHIMARLRGAPGQKVPVTLRREGHVVGNRTVQLDGEGHAKVDFKVTPMEVGRFAWEVSVPVDPDDAVPGNNTAPVVVRVVRDRMRVLQVSGGPSYDQKFLRLFLKEDPSVDLVSFFILRTREDMGAGWRSDELSLIAFPYPRLFSADLETFDVVVLQDFDYEPYFEWQADRLLGNLAEYVRKGGALVMIGGDRSFDKGGYAGTPLAEVLPVKLGVRGPKTDEAKFRPELTRAGLAHPITRLMPDGEDNAALWRSLPELDGINRVAGLAPGAAALLQHPTSKAEDGSPAPVLAVREVGRGRTMALMTDASWRWSFSEAARGRGNQAYLRFWKNAFRWLVADPEDRRVVVAPSRENVLLGDGVRLAVKVRDAGYLPVGNAQVTGVVSDPEGGRHPFDLRTDAAGEATVTFTPTMSGAHRVRVRVGRGPSGQAETVFAVSTRDPERIEIVPDTGFLKALADRYGARGAYRGPGDDSAPLLDEGAGREVREERELALASMPLTALLFGLLSSLAWWLRRRAGAR